MVPLLFSLALLFCSGHLIWVPQCITRLDALLSSSLSGLCLSLGLRGIDSLSNVTVNFIYIKTRQWYKKCLTIIHCEPSKSMVRNESLFAWNINKSCLSRKTRTSLPDWVPCSFGPFVIGDTPTAASSIDFLSLVSVPASHQLVHHANDRRCHSGQKWSKSPIFTEANETSGIHFLCVPNYF